ncbi:MAG: outer membrane protein OmpK [Campylobacterota bacterium]|nr:outer membrane protein OmpK [Campylobacterota bacterium]
MKIFLITVALSLSLLAFEATNVQLLYSNDFKGNAFIYDTLDGEKTTFTFEHFRTFKYGDFYMFVDMMKGIKFDDAEYDIYSEIAPRFSLSKVTKSDFSFSFFKDLYIASQINMGKGFRATLLGIGTDIEMPLFAFFSANIYHRNSNLVDDTYQITLAYETLKFHKLYLSGFIDMTSNDVNTHNQFLYQLYRDNHSSESLSIGAEWVYYNHSDLHVNTSVLQAMIKYQF